VQPFEQLWTFKEQEVPKRSSPAKAQVGAFWDSWLQWQRAHFCSTAFAEQLVCAANRTIPSL
jgi:hypothetical protein